MLAEFGHYIEIVNLQTLDLNLLKVFEALAEERSATRAGERVGLTQSSVSNALNRLRQVFGDELFVRTPQGMQPTLRAEQLEGPVRVALSQLREALANPTSFDLASATGAIRIATPDFVVPTLATKLLDIIIETAPNIDLRFIPLDKRTVFSDLDADRIDLAITAFIDVPARVNTQSFMRDRFICAGRVGHPAFENGLSLEDYVSHPHVLVSYNADQIGVIDAALSERGLSRRVGVTVGHFQSVPAMLVETDYLSTIPASCGPTMTALGTCETTMLPFDLPDWPIDMHWSRRAEGDPLQAWARARIVEFSTPR